VEIFVLSRIFRIVVVYVTADDENWYFHGQLVHPALSMTRSERMHPVTICWICSWISVLFVDQHAIGLLMGRSALS
jgi:hypothetical protein